jgi:enoyl-CoA hydratase
MSKFDNVQYEVEGPIAIITLDRVRYRNALSDFLMSDLDSAFKEAVKDRDVRVITLFGAGDHFSGGHDLGSPQREEGEQLNLGISMWNEVFGGAVWRNLLLRPFRGTVYSLRGQWHLAPM